MHFRGEGGKKVRCPTGIISQEPEYLSGPPHSVAVALCARSPLTERRLQQKLLRKKKNESWAMRRLVVIRGLTSPTLGVGGNLLCSHRTASKFPGAQAAGLRCLAARRTRAFRRAAVKCTRAACAPQSDSLRYSYSCRLRASRRKQRRLRRRRQQSYRQSWCRQRGSISRSINLPRLSRSFHLKTSSRSKFNA